MHASHTQSICILQHASLPCVDVMYCEAAQELVLISVVFLLAPCSMIQTPCDVRLILLFWLVT